MSTFSEVSVFRIASSVLAIVAAGALVHAQEAQAQSHPTPSGTPSSNMTTHVPPPKTNPDARSADNPVGLTAQVQLTLDRTADDLRINAGQQKAWDAYATRVLRLADDISRARFAAREAQSDTVTAPQVFDRIGEIAQNRLTAVEEIVDAGRALYARLSPEQQRLADRKLALVALTLASGVAPAAGDGAAPRKP
jgi:hypothetical protein